MRKIVVSALLLGSVAGASQGAEAQQQANAFARIYTSLCMKHVGNIEGLRSTLKDMPKLPKESARHFLTGLAGDAWPVPDKHGSFVLALPRNKNLCLLYGRKASSSAVERLFVESAGTAPTPLNAKRVAARQEHAAIKGPARSIAYEWSVPDAKRTMLFTLTTASSDKAPIQVLGSASLVEK